jgi:type II secretory pathway pseudopilin PulG
MGLNNSYQRSAISSQLSAISYQPSVPKQASSTTGFTVLEIVMVIAIMGVLAGAITPVALRLTQSKKESTTREELETLKKAIIGAPESTQWGKEATFGYLGDMGSLPPGLQDLYIKGAGVPSFAFNSTLGIGAGWRGPYVGKKGYTSVADFLQDPYGNNYAYSTTVTTDAILGVEVRGTIRSIGPDDTSGTQDDLSVEMLRPEVLADVAGKVKDTSGAGIPGIYVTINYPSGGTLTSSTVQTDVEGRYQFSNIPMGERAITLQPGLVLIPGTALAGIDPLSGLQEVLFSVANLSSSNITVSSIATYCYTNPDTYYGRIKINGATVTTLSPRLSTEAGTAVGFTPLVVAGSTMQRAAFRLLLQSSKMEIPEIELNTVGAGGTMTIQLQDFATAPTGGSPVEMAGIPFRIVFSNGSIVIFTPQKR